MTTLLDRIRTDATAARKRAIGTGLPTADRPLRDQIEPSLLTTLLGELETLDKAGHKVEGTEEFVLVPLTEEATVDLVRKFVKNADGVLAAVKGKPSEPSVRERVMLEKEILSTYMPQMMSEAEIEAFLRERIASGEPARLGDMMKALKTAAPGPYDGRLASSIAGKLAQ